MTTETSASRKDLYGQWLFLADFENDLFVFLGYPIVRIFFNCFSMEKIKQYLYREDRESDKESKLVSNHSLFVIVRV